MHKCILSWCVHIAGHVYSHSESNRANYGKYVLLLSLYMFSTDIGLFRGNLWHVHAMVFNMSSICPFLSNFYQVFLNISRAGDRPAGRADGTGGTGGTGSTGGRAVVCSSIPLYIYSRSKHRLGNINSFIGWQAPCTFTWGVIKRHLLKADLALQTQSLQLCLA